MAGNRLITDPRTSPAPDFGNAAAINAFMAAQAANAVRSNLPGYEGLISQDSANIGSNLRGEVPADVLRLLQQQAAERGVATGSPGSPNVNASYLQALGLTSLGLQEQGQKGLTAAVERTPVPQLFNPASLFVPQTLAAQELAAARSGSGVDYSRAAHPGWGGGSGGGVSYSPSASKFGRTASVPVGNAPGILGPYYGGGGGNSNFGTMMTNDAIMSIANGNLGGTGSMRIQDPGMAPAPDYQYQYNPYDDSGAPPGTSYNPIDDTSYYDPFAGYYD